MTNQVFSNTLNQYAGNNGVTYTYTPSEEVLDWKELVRKIWEVQWMITTRKKWALSEEQYLYGGIETTGDAIYDNILLDDYVNTTRTISEMVEMYDAGKDFILRNPNDAQVIFDIILEYTDYVGERINTSLHLLSVNAEENVSLRQTIEDVVKLQNLGNKLFPLAVKYGDHKPTTQGILGFLYRDAQQYGYRRLEFDPIAKYGFTLQDLDDPKRRNERTGEFKAVNLANLFNPDTLEHLRGVYGNE